MAIGVTKTRAALALTAGAALIPATAFASHVFDDVPDGAFYAAPVAWAFDNDITTGKSPTSFAPLDDVTRGESVTFLKRYDDNIVQPALDSLADGLASVRSDVATVETAVGAIGTLEDDLDDIETGLDAAETTHDNETGRLAYQERNDEDDWTGGDLTTTTSIDVPVDGFLLVNYSSNLALDGDEFTIGDVVITAELAHDGVPVDHFYQYIDLDAISLGGTGVPQTMAFTQVLEATAGANEVSVTLSHPGGLGEVVYVHSERLSVLFVPFDGAGPGAD